MTGFDPYAALGLDRDATPEQIRAAFRRTVRRHHPDTAAEGGDGSAVREAIDAYRLLIDPTARAAHDRAHLRSPGTPRRPDRRWEGGAERPRRRTATPCRTCLGAGLVQETVACPVCRGRAEITDLSEGPARVLRCRTCTGHGRVTATQRCPDCRGRGSMPPASDG